MLSVLCTHKKNKYILTFFVISVGETYTRHEAVVLVLIHKEDAVFNEDSTSSQDEGGEEVDVDVVSCAVELPVLSFVNTELFLQVNLNVLRKGMHNRWGSDFPKM